MADIYTMSSYIKVKCYTCTSGWSSISCFWTLSIWLTLSG